MWRRQASLFVSCHGLERCGLIMMVMMTGMIAIAASAQVAACGACGPVAAVLGLLSPQRDGKGRECWLSRAWAESCHRKSLLLSEPLFLSVRSQ